MLYTKRDQLSRDLLYLVKEDSDLLSDIIYNYCQIINNKQFNDLEDVVNTKVSEIIWSLFIYFTVLLLYRSEQQSTPKSCILKV